MVAAFWVVAAVWVAGASAVPISSANLLFGHAIKNGPLPAATEVRACVHVHVCVCTLPVC